MHVKSLISKINNKEHLRVIFKKVKHMSKMMEIQKSRNTIFTGSYKTRPEVSKLTPKNTRNSQVAKLSQAESRLKHLTDIPKQ